MSNDSAYAVYDPKDYRKITYAKFQMWCTKCNVETLNMMTGEVHHEFVWVGKSVRCTRCGTIPINPSDGNKPWENVGAPNDPDNINVKIMNDWIEAKKNAGM